jgi:hypothetical protein
MRACLNETMDASRLKVLTQQGWTFIPTWVGPQAPCIYDPNDRLEKFAADPATAFSQGRAEAEQALQVAAELELANCRRLRHGDLLRPGSLRRPDTACVEASRAFVAGWTQRLQEAAATPVSTPWPATRLLRATPDAPPAPDAVWFAAWNREQGSTRLMTVWAFRRGVCPPTVWNAAAAHPPVHGQPR